VLRNACPSGPEPVPECSGMGARVVRNQGPGAAGTGAQVTPERVPESRRNTQALRVRA
jgi:hypothetical protein